MALNVNTYLYMEKIQACFKFLNLLLLTQRNSVYLSHTNPYILKNKETAHVGTAVWARVFEGQPVG